jgi:aspartyl-tRNA(Asn)/glutamyl-tRNA(Gln) amidotransferase subunit B
MTYTPIIGAEIHVELNTKSKMFCGCKNDPFHADRPNIHTCPVCLGLPGALPVPNKRAIEDCILIGLALNCEIAKESKFDRKHYFYPDLPKGYQISQYDEPFCEKGYLDTSFGRVGITRVHMEEDTAKLTHSTVDGKRVSLIDFNRSSVPLVEIVTEPDIHSAEQAKEFLKKLRDIIRTLGVSDADMEKGGMRLECNISLSPDGKLPDYKVEVKNINSFRYFANSVESEIVRHTELLDAGKVPVQETRGYRDSIKGTVSQRVKEEAADYRYFPDPDIPPIIISEEWLSEIKSRLPELPEAKQKILKELGVSDSASEVLVKNPVMLATILEFAKLSPKLVPTVANLLVNKKVDADLSATDLIKHLDSAKSGTMSDEGQLTKIIEKVIADNPTVVTDYQGGKHSALGFLMGQIMRATHGKADPKLATQILTKQLKG